MEIDTNNAVVGPAPTSCCWNYCVTAHKSTSVTHSAVGHFTSAADVNLIIAKGNRLEIHVLSSDGLQALLDVPIYGRITALELFRPKNEAKDLLFIHTERYKFCVLEYDSASGDLLTRATGDLRDAIGRPVENGQLAALDPECRMMGLHLYDGMLKVIPIDERGGMQEAFNVRLEEASIIAMQFLAGCARSTVVLLYEDVKHSRHVRTYEILVKEKDLAEGPFQQAHVDAGAGILIPVSRPLGGVLVVGESTITYLNTNQQPKTVPLKQTIVRSWGRIDEDGSRYLLSDFQGALTLVVLAHDGVRVAGIKLDTIGKTSAASSLSYIDNGLVYVGSSCGDSQLVRLHAEPLNATAFASGVADPEPPNYVEVLETFVNLGPIIDFEVVDLERQGQGQVVTCSGIMGDGSLRIIRSGIGINEQAAVELPGIKGVWSLRPTTMDVYDKYLVLTFVGETRVLGINAEDELDEAALPGFEASALTLHCANTVHDQLVQVTGASVRLIDAHTQQLVHEWTPPGGTHIHTAAGSPSQVLVATGEGRLVSLEVGEGTLREVATTTLGAEIACLDISPTGDSSEASSLAAVGTWGMQVHVLRLPGLEPAVAPEALGAEVIPRSVLMWRPVEGVAYLLCGLGDGQLHSWRMDAESGALSDRKKVSLGTKPILLRTFTTGGASNVFAASDRPTIIYCSNKKLLYSNLNEEEVNFMASFNSASFPDSLAIAKQGSMTIGTIDAIQKLHVRTVPLHEQPRRITHQESTKTYAVLTIAGSQTTYDDEPNFVRFLDDQTFDVLATYPLDHMELGCSIATMTLGDDPAVYYVVGTTLMRPDEHEPSRGRLLVLQYDNGKVQLVAEKEIKGAAYSLLSFQGKLLVSVNNKVYIYKWALARDGGGDQSSARELVGECNHVGHVLALYLASRGDFVLVGDLMRSVTLLMYKPEETMLEVRARDYSSSWTTAVAMLDDDTYLVSDNSYNLYVVRKNPDAATDEDRGRLDVVGEYHVGQFVNRFRHGSLVMRLPDSELAAVPTVLYGTVCGALGLLASLPQPLFATLDKLQAALRKVIKGVGGFDHETWRSFTNERKTCEARGFIDGDLIEQTLDLPQEQLDKVLALMGDVISKDELLRKVEELTRLH